LLRIEATALIDGGSTHSFVNPSMLNSEQRVIFESIKSKCETGVVREDCYIIRGQLTFVGWTGDVLLVMSSLLNKNQVVLGLDFLKQYKIKEDHGNDTLEIDID